MRQRQDPGRLRRIWNTYTLPAFMLLIGLVSARLTLPILPPAVLINHALFDGDDVRT